MSTSESHIEPIANGFPSKDLLRRYLRGELTPEERAELEQYLTDEEGMLKDALEGLMLIEDEAQFDRALGRIQQSTRMRLRERHVHRRQRSKRRNRVQPKVRDIMPYLISAAAAVALLIVGVFVFQEYGGGAATESSAPPLAQHQPPAAPAPEPLAESSSPAREAESPDEGEAELEPAAAPPQASARGVEQVGPPAETTERQRAAREAAAARQRDLQQRREEVARLQEQAMEKKAETKAGKQPDSVPSTGPLTISASPKPAGEPMPPAMNVAPAAAEDTGSLPLDRPAEADSPEAGQEKVTLDEVVITGHAADRSPQEVSSIVSSSVEDAPKRPAAVSLTQRIEDSLKVVIQTDDAAAAAEARWNLAQHYLQAGKTGKAKRQLKKLTKEENAYQQRAAQLLEEL
jgi:hypothetical protein